MHTLIHTYIKTLKHTCIHTYIHTWILAYINAYLFSHKYIHDNIISFFQSCDIFKTWNILNGVPGYLLNYLIGLFIELWFNPCIIFNLTLNPRGCSNFNIKFYQPVEWGGGGACETVVFIYVFHVPNATCAKLCVRWQMEKWPF